MVAILQNTCYINLHKVTFSYKEIAMYTLNNEGLLNNYATEPTIYFAEYPSTEQKQKYAFQGAIATLLVAAVTLIALAVS